MNTKKCPRCQTEKSFDDFYRTPKGSPSTYCKPCHRLGKAMNSSDRKYYYKKKYGITIEEYETLFESQRGICAICSSPNISEHLSIDHCHSSGKIRGLLCKSCNVGLGYFQDDPIRLKTAAAYLEKKARD